MFITKIAKRLHRGEKGFTLIELLVVLAILAVLVGLVLPNFFGVMEDADAIMMQGQHEKMREAVFLYHTDTGEWPTEWSRWDLGITWAHQLWLEDGVGGWDGPYLDRPILQENKWGGFWGVYENRNLNVDGLGLAHYTALLYQNVPLIVAQQIDAAMDDGSHDSGAVQYETSTWPGDGSVGAPGPVNNLEIIIAKQ